MNDTKISTKDVLKIAAVGGVVIASVVMPGLPMAISASVKAWNNVNKKQVTKIVKRLKNQQMIALKEKDGKLAMQVTEKGKKRLLQYDFEDMKLKSNKRDDNWRLVIFDIPNKKKVSRDLFRKKLKQLGFIQLQESVFATPFFCKDEIDFLCHYLLISDYVTIASVNKIERGEELVIHKSIQA